MKKIINLMVMLGAVCGFTACDLEITPDTAIAGKDAAHLKYVSALRNGIYNNMTTVTAYSNLVNTEYYTDLFNETINSGNRGGFFSRWNLHADDQEILAIWTNYYTTILQVNYALEKAALAIEQEPENAEELKLYMGEMYFVRAYMIHQLALRFCEDYDPDRADAQLGVPCPVEYAPGAQLPRGTLAQTYARITEDIKSAEGLVTTQGSQNSKYITVDAITAFKAQVALQMHDYDNAIAYASSLYSKYPLVNTREGLENLWLQGTCTETIMQLEVTRNTYNLIGATTDYLSGSYQSASGTYLYNPGYVPEQWVCDLFTADDYRYGPYVGPATIRNITGEGRLMMKLAGLVGLRSTETLLNYYNMPVVFRVAEMYLIEAEALYCKNGSGATPLSTLRTARGLKATGATGETLFTEIQKECVREFIGEGHRLFDLKRWGIGMKRNAQTACISILAGGTTIYEMQKSADDPQFVWPIPQYELQNNPNFGEQNEGYRN